MASSVNDPGILYCGICSGTKTQPKYLNCHHSFCSECLTISYQGAATIDCPTCATNTSIPNGIAGLVDNLEYQYFQALHTSSKTSINIDNIDTGKHRSFHIFVTDIYGGSQMFHVKETDFIEDLKREVQGKIGIRSENQSLFYRGKLLLEGKRLSFYKISKGSTISLILRLLSFAKTQHSEITQSLDNDTDESGNSGDGSFRIFVKDHDDVIKWKHFPRYWPFVRGIHRSTVNSPHKGQWRGALMFSLMCARINSWVNNREAGDLRRYRRHYDVIVMHSRGIQNVRCKRNGFYRRFEKQGLWKVWNSQWQAKSVLRWWTLRGR